MKLYFAPGARSLADHIALLEAGMSFEREKIDLTAKRCGQAGSLPDRLMERPAVRTAMTHEGLI